MCSVSACERRTLVCSSCPRPWQTVVDDCKGTAMSTGQSREPREPAFGGVSVVRDGDRMLVALWGEHDLSTVGVIDATLTRVATTGLDVVVDLRDVEFMDATTVGSLVNGRVRLERHRSPPVASSCPRHAVPVARDLRSVRDDRLRPADVCWSARRDDRARNLGRRAPDRSGNRSSVHVGASG